MEEPRECSALAIFGDFRQDFRDSPIKMQPEWTRARGTTFNLLEDILRSANDWARERQRTGQLVEAKATVEFISTGNGDSSLGLTKLYPLYRTAHDPFPSLNVQFKSLVTTRN